jgi:dihydropteroate synthase
MYSPLRKRNPLRLPGGTLLDFSGPLVMSIVNCTPDSFYAPSRRTLAEEAADAASRAGQEGADIVDFGAESTRPGADYVSSETEIARLVPAIRAFRRKSSLPVSVDTRKAAVARAALDEGADIINDISALRDDPDMAGLCAKRGAAVVLMHMRGNPRTMQAIETGRRKRELKEDPGPSLVAELRIFLAEAAERALAAGIAPENIIVDPGIGFGKTTHENLILINRLAEIRPGDYPLLIGLSRKRFIGELTGRETEDRLSGTLSAAAAALSSGADILRMHDTAAARDLALVFAALGKADSYSIAG